MNGPDEIDCVSEMNKLNGRELGEWDKFLLQYSTFKCTLLL